MIFDLRAFHCILPPWLLPGCIPSFFMRFSMFFSSHDLYTRFITLSLESFYIIIFLCATRKCLKHQFNHIQCLGKVDSNRALRISKLKMASRLATLAIEIHIANSSFSSPINFSGVIIKVST